MGLATYLHRGYNPFTEYHGHPSRVLQANIIVECPIVLGNVPAIGYVDWKLVVGLSFVTYPY